MVDERPDTASASVHVLEESGASAATEGHALSDLEQQASDAAKEYHDAIRRQKKAHWEDFLAEDANIWQAAKYLDPQGGSTFDKIPPLTRRDGSSTKDKLEQAEELLSAFFPPLHGHRR
jgi:hypothetical protein